MTLHKIRVQAQISFSVKAAEGFIEALTPSFQYIRHLFFNDSLKWWQLAYLCSGHLESYNDWLLT